MNLYLNGKGTTIMDIQQKRWADRIIGLPPITEETITEETYKEFFKKALDKFGVSSPDELEGDKKKEFFDYVDANWEGDNEEDEQVCSDCEEKVEEAYTSAEDEEEDEDEEDDDVLEDTTDGVILDDEDDNEDLGESTSDKEQKLIDFINENWS